MLDHAGDYCGSWTEQDFDAKTVELCGFPDGPAWGPHDFSVTCDSTTAQLELGYVGGPIFQAQIVPLYTGGALLSSDYVVAHGLDVQVGGTAFTPRASFSGSVPLGQHDRVPVTCDNFESEEVTYVLEVLETQNTVWCWLFGHDPEGVKDLSAFDEAGREWFGEERFRYCDVVRP